MTEIYINTSADAKKCVGQQVWWEEHSNRYIVLRTGIIEEVKGKNILLDNGNWEYITHLKYLRNFKNGGAWTSG